MTDQEINERIAVIMGLEQGKDFGEWPEHDWRGWGNRYCANCSRCEDEEPEKCAYVPNYSGDISLAWQAVERLLSRSFFSIQQQVGTDGYVASFEDGLSGDYWDGEADTAPRAICLAVIAALEGE